jgi:hypothetical protein
MIAQLIGVWYKIEDLEQIVKKIINKFSLTVLRQKIRASQSFTDVDVQPSKLNHQVFCFMEQPLGLEFYI